MSPAKRVNKGDFILKVNETNILSFNELKKIVNESNGTPLELDVYRNGTIFKVLYHQRNDQLKIRWKFFRNSKNWIIGGFALEPQKITPNILDAIQFGFLSTYRVINGSLEDYLR